jgi:Tfp pilus assembly protein PilF
MERGRYIDAEALLREAISDGVRSATVHAMLGLCLRRAGVHEAANEEIKTALTLDPNCAYVHYALSFLSAPTHLKHAPMLGGCVKHILRALELAPNEVTYLARLADLRQILQQWKESLEPIEAGLRLSPRHVGLAVQRAEALIHLGRRDEAHETLLRALQSDPEAASTYAGMGWALLRTGDYERATKFFEEALRLGPELGWAQHGALECAKHQYRSYRVLSFLRHRLVHRPLLRFAIEMGICCGLVIAAFAALFWLDPIIRPRWGGWPVVVIFMPLILLPFALQWGVEPFFAWRVRHHRAAQLSATEPIVKDYATRWVLGGIICGVTIFFAVLLGQSKSPAVFGLIGLVPGVASLAVTLFDVPGGKERKWLFVFSVVMLVVGPILLIGGRNFILDLDPDPRGSVLLLMPAIFVVIVSQRIKQKNRAQRHQQVVAASRQKIHSR